MPRAENGLPIPEHQISYDEFNTPRRQRLGLYRRYFDGSPPFPILDDEDPDRQKPRFVVQMPTLIAETWKTGLTSTDKFEGFDGLTFEELPEEKQELLRSYWSANEMESRLELAIDDYTWAGESNWEIIFDPTFSKVITHTRHEPEDVEIVWSAREPDSPLYALIQFYDSDLGRYERRELWRDMTLIYHGKIEEDEVEVETQGAFGSTSRTTVSETRIVWELDEVIRHELGFIPLVRFQRGEGADGRGRPVFEKILGKFDKLNEVFTETFFAVHQMNDPLLYVKGVNEESDVFKDADHVWYLASPDAALDILQWKGPTDGTFKLIVIVTSQILHIAKIPPELLAGTERLAQTPVRTIELLYQGYIDNVGRMRGDLERWLREMFGVVLGIAEQKSVTIKDGRMVAAPAPAEPELSAEEELERIRDAQGLDTLEEFRPEFQLGWGDILPRNMLEERKFFLQAFSKGLFDRESTILLMGFPEQDDLVEMARRMSEEEEQRSTLFTRQLQSAQDEGEDEVE